MVTKILKIFFLFLLLFFLLLIFLWQGIFLPKSFSENKEKIFLVKRGESIFQIAKNLEKEGLIRHRIFFVIYTIAKGKTRQLQAGAYLFHPSLMSPSQIADKIINGEVLKGKITILEGWRIKEIAKYLEEKGICQKEEFLKATQKDFSHEFSFLKDKPENLDVEGYLFPDTYEINYGESPEGIIRKMLKNFDQKLTTELREEITRQGKTIFEIVTLASLIEKEVYNTLECPNCTNLVSGILWKRLENKIPLQVDATITYLTEKRNLKISIQDTQIDSPYNTYRYLGLPKGPICNPGLESILAALYPKESDYWYYLTTPEGKTVFSKTLEEHNIAKTKYLK